MTRPLWCVTAGAPGCRQVDQLFARQRVALVLALQLAKMAALEFLVTLAFTFFPRRVSAAFDFELMATSWDSFLYSFSAMKGM